MWKNNFSLHRHFNYLYLQILSSLIFLIINPNPPWRSPPSRIPDCTIFFLIPFLTFSLFLSLFLASRTGRAVGLDENEPEGEVIVAVKTLKKGSSSEAKAEFDQEVCLMNFLSHPNIIKLLAVSAMEQPYCMIFEFMNKGDLSEYLRESEPLTESITEPADSNKSEWS